MNIDEDKLTPARGNAALLVIDMINDLQFEGAEPLQEAARSAAEQILRLREEADRRGVPTVYINDNYGLWHAGRTEIVAFCARHGSGGREVVEQIKPRAQDFFIIKPRFSGFYATALPVLLPKLQVSRLILTGVAADICVLFTAADAHMREYRLWVPKDTVASEDRQRTRWALEIMSNSMGAETRGVGELQMADWLDAAPTWSPPSAGH